MNTDTDAQKPSEVLKPVAVVFASLGLAILFSVIFAVIACSAGFLFSGLDAFSAVFCASLFSGIATAVSTTLFRQALKRFGWRLIWVEAALLALVSVGIVSWSDTRERLKLFMKPMAVPASVSVKHGRRDFFRGFVHFTASPSDIAALIQSKQLIEVPDWDPDGEAAIPEGFSERDRTKTSWDWWQPASMPRAKFFYRFHKTDFSGWVEGWWISGETNEIFAYFSGS